MLMVATRAGVMRIVAKVQLLYRSSKMLTQGRSSIFCLFVSLFNCYFSRTTVAEFHCLKRFLLSIDQNSKEDRGRGKGTLKRTGRGVKEL